MEVLTPKFLPKELAEMTVRMVIDGLFTPPFARDLFKRHMLHVVILVPSIEDRRDENFSNYPDYPIKPTVLYEHSLGDKEEWPWAFDEIARSKALQLWRGQNTDGNTDSMPHLLFPDDTPYWGGVKRHGLVVACSGVQSYFDQMIAGMIADALKALGHHMWELSADKKDDLIFIT
jgi:hypothetical protein